MSEPAKPRNTTEISLLGRSYTISCQPGEEDGLTRAAAYLDLAMQGIQQRGNTISADKVALMAALNISHELINSRDSERALQNDFETRLAVLDRQLDAALNQLPADYAQRASERKNSSESNS
ncbi:MULTISPECIES: cell division protein ZapA [Cobetia]|uniref:Cell division protein ZapA n=1 Tax=Cobetia crustatorum TaxID=553385 RepID=A0A558HS61_9GAMM|nr:MULTISPECIES: cell division protein ZapA [Cobetia]TVU71975.1 cell division protein ZapA [Cobetia crustatorum]